MKDQMPHFMAPHKPLWIFIQHEKRKPPPNFTEIEFYHAAKPGLEPGLSFSDMKFLVPKCHGANSHQLQLQSKLQSKLYKKDLVIPNSSSSILFELKKSVFHTFRFP